MVSARALEYITRFSKGVQKNTALKNIVEYREECKGMYNEAETKNPMNFRAAEDKREYLSDMRARIKCLAETRDYLQEQINAKAHAKKGPAMSAMPFAPRKEVKKPAKRDEGIKYIGNNGEDDWEDFQRVWGRT